MTELGIVVVVLALFAGILFFGRRRKAEDECGGCCAGIEQARRELHAEKKPD